MPVVSHTLTRPGGVAMADEIVHIRLLAASTGEGEGFVAGSKTGILSEYKVRTDAAGTWSVTLTANALIVPANTTYQVIQPGISGGKVTETFIVPNGAGPYWLGDILADPPGTLVSAALSLHEADTTAVHGIVDTAALVTTDTAQTITGLKTVQPAAASAVGLIVQGVVSQTGDLLQAKDSGGTTVVRILSTGGASFDRNGTSGVGVGGTDPITGFSLAVLTTLATRVPVLVRGAAFQSAALTQWQSDTAAVLASISAAGRIAATFAEGFRTLELGAADSAGAGFRAVRVPN